MRSHVLSHWVHLSFGCNAGGDANVETEILPPLASSFADIFRGLMSIVQGQLS